MPLDFRYHLASLTAVFVALIIGILLGVAMTDAPDMRTQIQDLRKEFKRSEVLKKVDEKTNRFNERTLPLLVKNRMFGRNVVLVQNTVTFSDEKMMAAVREAFTLAGATITAEVALKPTLLQVTPEQAGRVYMRVQRTPPEKAGTANLMRLLATDLGSDLFHVAPALQKEKLISVRGDTTLPISTVVLLGGGDAVGTAVKTIDMPFLQACDERELRLAAVEPLDTKYSAIPLYRKASPITVDDIDRAAGRIALIFALSENQTGDYGYKSTANDVMPEIDE